MAAAVKRPDIREQAGTALNSSRLQMRANVETPLDRVAGLGAATLAIQSGAAQQRLPVAAVQPAVLQRSRSMADLMLEPPVQSDDQDRLAGELGALLWHIRYGGQHNAIPQASTLFAAWMRYRPRCAAMSAELLGKFALRVLHEWLSDRCIACGGSGKQEKTERGNWVRPQGRMKRNAIFRSCSICGGGGRSTPSHPERMKLLGLSREIYDAERWTQTFNAAHAWLGYKIRALKRPLTLQLERGKRRT